MSRKDDLLNWADSIDDDDLFMLMNEEVEDYKIPEPLYNKTLSSLKADKRRAGFGDYLRGLFEAKPVFRYAVSFAFILVLVCSVYVLYTVMGTRMSAYTNDCLVSSMTGNVYLVEDSGKPIPVDFEHLTEGRVVGTGRMSAVELKTGKDSTIKLHENTRIKIHTLQETDAGEQTRFILIEGTVQAHPVNIGKGSSYEIDTETVIVTVYGTQFNMGFNEHKTTSVDVIEGTVDVKLKMTSALQQELKTLAPDMSPQEIDALINTGIRLKAGRSLTITYKDYLQYQNNVINTIKQLKQETRDNDKMFNSIKKELRKYSQKEINKFKYKRKNGNKKTKDLFKKLPLTEQKKQVPEPTVMKEPVFQITKLPQQGTVEVLEKFTSVTTDGRKLYIADDNNRTIHCIDPVTGNIEWDFTHPELYTITMPVAFFNNDILVFSSDTIFILNQKGILKKKYSIDRGPSYWANPILFDDSLVIPTSRTILTYSGKTPVSAAGLPDAGTQLFTTAYDNKLLCVYPNEHHVKLYDPERGEVIWTSQKFINRIFMAPFVIGNTLYIADFNNNIYKQQIEDGAPINRIISIGSGIVSNIVAAENNLYFVDNDGFFNKLNVNKFDFIEKIHKIDIRPDMNKYLTKKLYRVDDYLYFCSDRGALYYFNVKTLQGDFLNTGALPLVGSPVTVNNEVYVVDKKLNVYRVKKF